MPVSSSAGPNVWLSAFLAVAQRKAWFQRKESRPPLYRYRCSDEEFQQLQGLLQGQGSALQQAKSRELSALFCLYAAEWLRRNHRGGAWTWDGVLKSLSLQLVYNDAQLYALVDQGLRLWGRPVMRDRRRSFLMSLASEGGVPAELVTQEAARFRPFFRDLLAEHQLFGASTPTAELARGLAAAALPRSLQRDIVYDLCGDLVTCVHNLQALVQGPGDALAQLDHQRPGWRDDLPLQLSEEASIALVRGLLDDARRVAPHETSRLRISTHLRLEGEQARLHRRVTLPSRLSGAQLGQLFGGSGLTNTARFILQLLEESGQRGTLALLTREGEADKACYVVEAHGREHLVPAPGVPGDLALLLVSASGNRTAIAPGGEARSELPWVFTADPDPEARQGSAWKLLSEGSVRTREPRVLVAVASKDQVTRETGAEPKRVGFLESMGRTLFLVEGQVRIQCASGGRCVVSTGDLTESFVEPRFVGEQVDTGRGSVFFRGMPRVLSRMPNGLEKAISPGGLRWRPAHSAQPWQTLSAECVGAIELRQEEHGETHWQARLAVLPEHSRLELRPQKQQNLGQVIVSGTGASHAGIQPGHGVQVVSLPGPPDRHGFELLATEAIPPRTRVELRWPKGQHLGLDLVFPAQGACFRGRDGQLLRSGAELVVDRLGGTQVEVFIPGPRGRPPRLSLSLREEKPSAGAANVTLDVAVSGGDRELYTLDLACVEATVRALFACSTELDSRVELEILGAAGVGGGSRARTLLVKRYDLTFDLGRRAQGELSLLQDSDGEPLDLERMELRAVPLREPKASELLTQVRPGTWHFSPEGRQPGPWLVLGHESGWSRVRPTLWTVNPGQQTAARSPLDAAILAGFPERAEKMKAALQALGRTGDSPDWAVMMAYVDLLTELPASTFAAVVALSEHPATAALALFVRGSQRMEVLWRGLEQLPFSWALVPVRDWRAAARVWSTGWRQALSPLSEELRAQSREFFLGEFKALRENIEARMPGLQPVFELLWEEVRQEPRKITVVNGQSIRRPSSTAMPAIRHSLTELLPLLELERRRLIENHEGEAWPQAPKLEEERLEFIKGLPPGLKRLFLVETTVTGDRVAVLQAPVLAALCAAWLHPLSLRARLELRRLQDFDPSYFAFVQGTTSRLALAELQASAPERLR